MIVNLGGDRTEIYVISEGKTIIQRTLRMGGHTLDEDIINMVKKQFQLSIGRKTAEALKNQLAYLLNGPAL
ncbi:MAG: rod shape-determining protein [Blautia sp.]